MPMDGSLKLEPNDEFIGVDDDGPNYKAGTGSDDLTESGAFDQ